MEKVLVIGGTGLVGKTLCSKLEQKGYEVSILSRSKNLVNSSSICYWNPNNNEIDIESLKSVDYIINLAGANISSQRWTKKRKKLIIDSRINPGLLILKTLKDKKIKIKAYISASAIGFYGAETSDKIFIENDLPADDFLGKVCQEWENTTSRFHELGIRTVKVRTGIVLTKHGGALMKLIKPIKFNLGSSIGTGKQYMPWIHIDDLCEIYIRTIQDDRINDGLNAVAPEHITNRGFTHTLASVLHKKIMLPNIPVVFMKLILGELSKIILNGSRVSPHKLKELGYNFNFPTLKEALKDILLEKTH